MKLLIGNGKSIFVYEVSEAIYMVEASGNAMLPLHQAIILDDDKAREVLNESLKHGKGRKLAH